MRGSAGLAPQSGRADKLTLGGPPFAVSPGTPFQETPMRLADLTRRRFLASAAGAGLTAALGPALARGQGARTDLDPKALQAVLDKAYDFLKSRQKPDGSFAPPRAGEPGVTALTAAALIRAGKDPS